jgi:predicted SnoaL-like aldol condensation-catalyzing enzyme
MMENWIFDHLFGFMKEPGYNIEGLNPAALPYNEDSLENQIYVSSDARPTGDLAADPNHHKAIVLEAFDTLFNKLDYAAAERFWSPKYIQHSAHIAPGREGLFALVRSARDTLRYENQLIVAEGDYVIAHGRFTGMGRPAAWIEADVVRFEDGLLAEHWDVLQDQATRK